MYRLNCAESTASGSEMADCGWVMGLYRDARGFTQDEQIQRVYATWETELPRLLIFDNCDDHPDMSSEKLLRRWMPRTGGSRVLVTSRRGRWSASLGVAPLPLGMLSMSESIDLLRKHRPKLGNDE